MRDTKYFSEFGIIIISVIFLMSRREELKIGRFRKMPQTFEDYTYAALNKLSLDTSLVGCSIQNVMYDSVIDDMIVGFSRRYHNSVW